MVKSLLLFAVAASMAVAESHPAWWAYVSPEANALIGIKSSSIRSSPLAAVIDAKVFASSTPRFPSLDCLKQADEIVVSSPDLLAVAAGSFPEAMVEVQAQRRGLSRSAYREVALWLPKSTGGMGVARVSDEILLVGTQQTLEAAIDRSLAESAHQDSPLFSKAAGLSESGDVWAVAAKLPDPLVGEFMPLETTGVNLLGQASAHDGLTLAASFDAASADAAGDFVRGLREKALSWPEAARGFEATADQAHVTITLKMTAEPLAAVLRSVPKPEEPADPVTFQVTHVESGKPQIVRIFYLDDGIHQITLPPMPPPGSDQMPVDVTQPLIVRILNLDEGVRGFVIPPPQ